MAERTSPRLASDVFRSYVGLGIGVLLVFPVGFAIGLLAVVSGTDPRSGAINLAAGFTAWALIAIVFCILILAAFLRADSATLRAWLRDTTPEPGRLRRFWWGFNGGGAIYWAMTGSGTAIVALILIATSGAAQSNAFAVGSGIAVVLSSVAVIICSYAVRYAREWATAGGLDFPGEQPPRFVDFLYLAVQVTTTFSASDVALTTSGTRKIVALHSLVAFAYNSVIVALLVSVLLSAVR